MASAPGGPAGWASQRPPAASAATNGATNGVHTELAVREEASSRLQAGPGSARAPAEAERAGPKGADASLSPTPPGGLSSAGTARLHLAGPPLPFCLSRETSMALSLPLPASPVLPPTPQEQRRGARRTHIRVSGVAGLTLRARPLTLS